MAGAGAEAGGTGRGLGGAPLLPGIVGQKPVGARAAHSEFGLETRRPRHPSGRGSTESVGQDPFSSSARAARAIHS